MAKQSPSEFWTALKKGTLATVYLLHGDDQRLADRAYKEVEQKVLEGGEPGFNADYFHGRDANPHEVVSAAKTLPMMADRRLVAVRRIEEMKVAVRDPIFAYLADPNPSTVLLCHAGRLDRREGDTKLENAIAKVGVVVNFASPKRWEIPKVVMEMAKARGRKMDDAAASALADLAGDDMMALEQELEKVILYRADRKSITREDVLEAVADLKEAIVFEFTDALQARNTEAALRIYCRMREQGNEPLMVLAMMVRHFRIIWKIQDLKAKGNSEGSIAQLAGINEWTMKKNYLPQLKEYPPRLAGRVMKLLADLDIQMKSTRTDKDILFERAIIKLCLRRL